VLIAWENEAVLAVKDIGKGQFDIVAPSLSILAEPPVAVVDKVAAKHGTRAAAEAYLKFLYTPEAQDIIARNYFRPRNAQVAAKYKAQFPNMKLFTIDRNFGGWAKSQALHFNDGGLFDQEYESAKR
jgi:sulfate/thiosulfate transport system substrate-binding protein